MKKIIFYFLLSVLSLNVISQNIADIPVITNVANKFKIFNELQPAEKVYLRLDKNTYRVDEDLFYSGFVVDYTTLKPSDVSQTLYVDLINIDGVTISSAKTQNIKGFAQGAINIPDTLSVGVYQIVAYSSLQKRTLSDDFYYRQTILIEDRVRGIIDFGLALENRSLTLRPIHFFSKARLTKLKGVVKQYSDSGLIKEESFRTDSEGQAVMSLVSKVKYVTVIAKYDRIDHFYSSLITLEDKLIIEPIVSLNETFLEGSTKKVTLELKEHTGIVKEGLSVDLMLNDRIIDRKTTNVNGRVSFLLGIKNDNNYYVRTFWDGRDYEYDFKLLAKKNTSTNYDYLVRRIDNKIFFNLYSGYETQNTVYMIGEMRGKIHFASAIDLAKDFVFGIDLANIPTGIMNTYLLNKEGKFIKKKTFYVDNRLDVIGMNVEKLSDTTHLVSVTKPESKGYINISYGQSSDRLFSPSIEDYLNFHSEVGISQIADLSSIDGEVISKGPTRYHWFEKDSIIIKSNEDKFLGYDLISGKAFYKNGKALQNESLILYSQSKTMKSWITKTDQHGAFHFDGVDIEKNAALIVSSASKSRKGEILFEIDKNVIDHTFHFLPKEWDRSEITKELEFDIDPNILMLSEVTKRGKRYYEGLNENKTRLGFVKTVKVDELQPGSSGGANGLIPLIQQATALYGYDINTGQVLLRPPTSVRGGSGVIFYLDGTRVGDSIYALSFLDQNDIEEIKIYKGNQALYFPFAPDGVIQFISKKGAIYFKNIERENMYILPSFYSTATTSSSSNFWLSTNEVNLVGFEHRVKNEVNKRNYKLNIDFLSSEGKPFSVSETLE